MDIKQLQQCSKCEKDAESSYPGGIVKRQCLEPLGLSVTRAAEGLGVTRQALSELVNGCTGVSVDMAIPAVQGIRLDPRDVARNADDLRPLASP